MASLFGFNLLAERLFVTRREFEQFQKALDIRLSKLEQTTSSGFDKLNDRIDKAFTAMAHSKDG